jgi:hypothetical protein
VSDRLRFTIDNRPLRGNPGWLLSLQVLLPGEGYDLPTPTNGVDDEEIAVALYVEELFHRWGTVTAMTGRQGG